MTEVNDIEKVRKLAEQLLREGHVDNEPDARLMAIRIILAAEGAPSTDRGADDDE